MNESDNTGDQTSATNSNPQLEQIQQMLNDLRESVSRFQNDPTPENFAPIINSLKGFGMSGSDLWRQAVDYTRQNPLKVAMYAGVAFFAIRGMMSDSDTRSSSEGDTSDRQLTGSLH